MKIALACGGTGGHIFPAVSVAEELKARDPGAEILYLCGKKDIEHAIFRIVEKERVISVESAPWRGARSLWDPSFLLRLASGLARSWKALGEHRPDVVAGFGGHYSFPVIQAALWRGIPALIHEQNAVPGIANRFLAGQVAAVAVSFPETGAHLPEARRLQVTGNPIRASIEAATRGEGLRFFGFSPEKKTLLVLGGSQGSQSINAALAPMLERLPPELRGRLQLLHLAGGMAPEASEAAMRAAGVDGRAYSFFQRMDLAYAVTDLAVGRAGATFLAEIAAKGIPAVLVPYPFGGGHQLENARAFARSNEAAIIGQSELTPERLAREVSRLLERGPLKPAAPSDARRRLADLILETART